MAVGALTTKSLRGFRQGMGSPGFANRFDVQPKQQQHLNCAGNRRVQRAFFHSRLVVIPSSCRSPPVRRYPDLLKATKETMGGVKVDMQVSSLFLNRAASPLFCLNQIRKSRVNYFETLSSA